MKLLGLLPGCLLLTGTYTIAEQMAAELARHRIEHRLVGIAGGEHGYQGANLKLVEAGHREAFEFVLRHL